MGTSASKHDAKPGFPLIPPWAEQDPIDPSPDSESEPKPEEGENSPETIPPTVPVAPSKPFNGFRRNLRQYVSNGDRDHARTALGHWVNTSRGGASTGTRRLSRAARSGAGALAAMARAAADQAPLPGELDLRKLAGLPADAAIDQIVDAFCPPGILDEDALRAAIGEALASLLAGADKFDPASIDQGAIRAVVLRFVAELVFVSVMLDSGESLSAAPPSLAIQRENGLRDLIREVVDIAGTPVLDAAGTTLNRTRMEDLVSQLVAEAHRVIATWE